MNSKEILLKLSSRMTEEEVKGIVDNEVYFKEGYWKPLGGNENNFGVVYNQQSHPTAALVEKIINSVDAILLKECKLRDIDPQGKDAPKSMLEAAEKFFGIKDGKLDELSQEKRKNLSKNTRLIADGILVTKNGENIQNPNIIIADNGEGQNPDDFEDTFLALLSSKTSKRKIPFVQGMYYMGGSGVLRYCGKYNYELILSRKMLQLLDSGQEDLWGWTLIRLNREKERYEYFINDMSEIPSFKGCDLEIFPDGELLSYGSFVKMYNYRMGTTSHITSILRKFLDIFLYQLALPVLLQETRDFRSGYKDIVLYGNKSKILSQHKKWMETKGRPLLEEHLIRAYDLGELKRRKIEIFIFSPDLKSKENVFSDEKNAITFTINGQTHATLGRTFIKNRARLPRLASKMLVNIDCTDIGFLRREIFMASRDRMTKEPIAKEVEEELANILRNDKILRHIDESWYQKMLEDKKVDDIIAGKIIERLIKTNPALRQFLRAGGIVRNPVNPGKMKAEIEDYNPEFIPTIFRIKGWDRKKGIYRKEVPVNAKWFNMPFELNAPNDYFDREKHSGELRIAPNCYPLKGRDLSYGELSLRIGPKEGTTAGDEEKITIEVTRFMDEPLKEEFFVKYTPFTERPPGGKKRKKEKSTKLEDLDIPKPVLIFKDKWDQFDWSAEDVVKVEAKDNDSKPSDLTVYINMDSNDLLEFKKRRRFNPNMIEMVDRSYEIGVLLNALAMYMGFSKLEKEKFTTEDFSLTEDLLPETIKLNSKIMLDLIWSEDFLKKIEEE